jgi:hypothetical protein
MGDELRAQALAKLRRLAAAKERYDGTVLPSGWAELIAPLLRYTLSNRGKSVWDCNVKPEDAASGRSIFTLKVPPPWFREFQPERP